MIEKDIIQDQKETIHRLQEECKEKTDIIMALGQKNEELRYEIDRQKDTIFYLNNLDVLHKTLLQYKTALEEIREVLKGNKDGDVDGLIDKINEVLND